MARDDQKTAAEQADDIRLKREQMAFEREELLLEQTRDTVVREKAERVQVAVRKKMSQATLQKARQEAAALSRACKHRQGGESGQIYKGKGPTSLKVEKHPDGFSVLIRCLNCPLRVLSPIPSDASRKLKPGETPEEAKQRLAKYVRDKARFDKFYEMSQEDALTADAAQPMEPGTTFKVTDGEGNQIFKPRPGDSYASYQEMAGTAA